MAENQMVTVRGVYTRGEVFLLADTLPVQSCEVLVTFVKRTFDPGSELEPSPIDWEKVSEQNTQADYASKVITPAEQAVLPLVQQGLTNREIAEALELKEGTIRNRVSTIFSKLGVQNRTELVTKVIRLGLVPNPFKKE